jgi:hypothetical protein
MGRELEKQTLYDSAKKGKSRSGQNFLMRHCKGTRLTPSQAIKAKCYDCNGMGEERICENEECSLWPYSQFAKGKPKPSSLRKGNADALLKARLGMAKKRLVKKTRCTT